MTEAGTEAGCKELSLRPASPAARYGLLSLKCTKALLFITAGVIDNGPFITASAGREMSSVQRRKDIKRQLLLLCLSEI